MVLSASPVQKENPIYYFVYYCALKSRQEHGRKEEREGRGAWYMCICVCVWYILFLLTITHGANTTTPYSTLGPSLSFTAGTLRSWEIYCPGSLWDLCSFIIYKDVKSCASGWGSRDKPGAQALWRSVHCDTDAWARSRIRKRQQNSGGCWPTQHPRHPLENSRSTLWRTRSLLTASICPAEPLGPWAWAPTSSVNTFPSQTVAAPRGWSCPFDHGHFCHIYQMTLWGQRTVWCFVSLSVLLYIFLFVLVLGTFWINRPPSGWVYIRSIPGVEDGGTNLSGTESEALLTYSCWLKPDGESPSVGNARVEMLAWAFRPLFNYGFFLLTVTKTDRNTFFVFFKHVVFQSKGSETLIMGTFLPSITQWWDRGVRERNNFCIKCLLHKQS